MTEQKRVNINIDSELHMQFKTFCAAKKITIGDFLTAVIEEAVNGSENESNAIRKDAINEVIEILNQVKMGSILLLD